MDARFCVRCRRRIYWLDVVGWLHVDDRVYFVPQAEPACDTAEPAEQRHIVWHHKATS